MDRDLCKIPIKNLILEDLRKDLVCSGGSWRILTKDFEIILMRIGGSLSLQAILFCMQSFTCAV